MKTLSQFFLEDLSLRKVCLNLHKNNFALVNPALPSFHERLLEITLTVPLGHSSIDENYYSFQIGSQISILSRFKSLNPKIQQLITFKDRPNLVNLLDKNIDEILNGLNWSNPKIVVHQ